MAKNPSRKSFVEIAPSYLGGAAAVATATVAVLSFVHRRDDMPDDVRATSPATEAITDRCKRIVGAWQWYTGEIPGVLTFAEDQQVGASVAHGAAPVLLGSWTCDESSGNYTIRWQNNVVERVTLAEDGRTASGSNNLDMPVRGSALPE